ncbi:MAG: hypothetical protein ABFS86_01325 [Planctomycetota bacterium]
MKRRTNPVLLILPTLVVLFLSGTASAAGSTPPEASAGLSLAGLVEVLARPGTARTGLALLGAIGVFRWRKRRRRGDVL